MALRVCLALLLGLTMTLCDAVARHCEADEALLNTVAVPNDHCATACDQFSVRCPGYHCECYVGNGGMCVFAVTRHYRVKYALCDLQIHSLDKNAFATEALAGRVAEAKAAEEPVAFLWGWPWSPRASPSPIPSPIPCETPTTEAEGTVTVEGGELESDTDAVRYRDALKQQLEKRFGAFGKTVERMTVSAE